MNYKFATTTSAATATTTGITRAHLPLWACVRHAGVTHEGGHGVECRHLIVWHLSGHLVHLKEA